MSKNHSATDRIKTAETEDQSLGEQVPGAPFAVVGLTYIVILGVTTLAVAFLLWLMN